MYTMNNHSRLESITVKKNLMYGREDDNKPSKILLKWNWGYDYQGALRTFSGPVTQKIKWMEERTDRIFAFLHPQKIRDKNHNVNIEILTFLIYRCTKNKEWWWQYFKSIQLRLHNGKSTDQSEKFQGKWRCFQTSRCWGMWILRLWGSSLLGCHDGHGGQKVGRILALALAHQAEQLCFVFIHYSSKQNFIWKQQSTDLEKMCNVSLGFSFSIWMLVIMETPKFSEQIKV